jgi:hypothetical protein
MDIPVTGIMVKSVFPFKMSLYDRSCSYMVYLDLKGIGGSLVGLRARCLIHNAHLAKIPIFCKILDLKITHLKKNCD